MGDEYDENGEYIGYQQDQTADLVGTSGSSGSPSAFERLFGGLGALGQLAIQRRGVEAEQQLGELAAARASQMGTMLQEEAQKQFKPFTVTTGLGPGISVGQEGISVTMPESQEQVARDIARQGGQQLLSAIGPGALQSEQERLQGLLLGQGVGAAQQDIYNQLQAMRSPEQERQRLALENRLFQQGRSGIRTAQYGGTPEQLAFEKAIQEQQAADALTARQQAVAEQQQTAGLIAEALGQGRQQQQMQAALGLGGIEAAFLPQEQALRLLTGGVPFSELATRAGLQGVTTRGALELGGLEALANAYKSAGFAEQQQLNLLGNALFGTNGALLGEGGTGLFADLASSAVEKIKEYL